MSEKRNRGFEFVDVKFRKFNNNIIKLPLRGSKNSAGYDFYSNENVTIEPGKQYGFVTDVKAYMNLDEYLEMNVRSSIGIKKNLMLSNTTGIIDMDYYSNPSNDGNITIFLRNVGSDIITIEEGERISQGIFKKYLESDNCNTETERIGGLGSTGIK